MLFKHTEWRLQPAGTLSCCQTFSHADAASKQCWGMQGWILGAVLGGCWLPVTAECQGNMRERYLTLFLLRGHSQLCPFLPFWSCLLPSLSCPQQPPQSPQQPPLLRSCPRRSPVSLCSRGAAHTRAPGGCLDKPLTLWEKDSL